VCVPSGRSHASQTKLGALRSHGATPQGAGGRPASTRGDPPGEESQSAKVYNNIQIFFMKRVNAFVGRCGGIAHRENGTGFVLWKCVRG